MTTVAAYVAQQLAAWGIQRIYGVVGDTFFPFIHAIAGQPGLRFVPVRHEAAAGFMASAEAKLTGQPAACLATSGPGLANLLNGLGDAHADRAPVLAITGQVATKRLGTGAKQDVDQQALVRPLVGFTALAAHPDAVGLLLPAALRTALAEGRPAHLAVPRDLWEQPCPAAVTGPEPDLTAPPVGSPRSLAGAVDRMTGARRPLILVGQGARAAGGEVLALAEHWGAGILQSLAAKGAVPWSHPLVLGGLGEGGTDAAHAALAEADLLLMVGCNWWPGRHVPGGLPVIKVDRAPAHLGGPMRVERGIAGAVGAVLPRLLQGLQDRSPGGRAVAGAAWRARLADLKGAWQRTVDHETRPGGPLLSPQHVVRALELALPPDAIVTLDTGDHTVWFNRIFGGAQHEVLVSGTWRSLGFGLPAALAAKLARPERTVAALVGDAGLQSLLGELVTAAELGLPLAVVVFNNGMMAIEYHRMVAQGYEPVGTQPRNPDFSAVAAACGLAAHRVRSAPELARALQLALSGAGPVLIDVTVAAPVAPTVQS